MNLEKQESTPLFDAVKKYISSETISFHVPGHKHGKGMKPFTDFVGSKVMNMDLTILPDLDSICHPKHAIKEAEKLAADAYGADQAFFLVNGTTSGIQAMIMALCKTGEKIIVPRNVHKSVIGGIILSGAIPVYMKPEIDQERGITKNITPEAVQTALQKVPEAKAVFVINPTYYGMTCDIQRVIKIADAYKVPVIADEAHGAHFPFHPSLPDSAMKAGAAMSAVSMHKLGGSMTQSSILLSSNIRIRPHRIKSFLNLSQTTSPSYVLLSSLDAARSQLAVYGNKMLSQVIDIAEKTRWKIDGIDGVHVFGKEVNETPGCFMTDPTKVTITVKALGLHGYEAEKFLRDRHSIAFEMSDSYNLLAVFSLGDSLKNSQRLVDGIKSLSAKSSLIREKRKAHEINLPDIPDMVLSPTDAFHSKTKPVPIKSALGEISAEMIMAYPPGIPIICPGERITKEVVDYIKILKESQCRLEGTEDPSANMIQVIS